jgi:four helix bundle protein
MQDYRKLLVWRKAHQLTLQVYRKTRAYPKEELYGLVSQTRRAAASIPANICEGCGRDSGADFARFLQIALGSAFELDYHITLAHDLGCMGSKDSNDLGRDIAEVRQMLYSLFQKVSPKTHRKESSGKSAKT